MTEELFDVMGHLSGRTYPDDTVTVFIDEDAMLKLRNLEAKISETLDGGEVNRLDEEKKVLEDQLVDSALTFHLRGIPKEVKDAISEKAKGIEDPTERGIFEDISALEAHIVSITRSDGSKGKLLSYDQLLTMAKGIPPTQWEKLISKVVELSYTAILYEKVTVNPDF